MKFLIIITVFTITIFSCTNESSAKKALLDSGYHPIDVGGYAWFDGSDDDVFKTRFKAYSPDSSRIVTGTVCSGWFKGSTIRLD
jgi:hypothetical protein